MTLAEIATVVAADGIPSTATAVPITGVSTDTRTIGAGDLFVALDGPTSRGSDYIDAAFDRGAAAAVSPRGSSARGPVLQVADAGQALLALGACQRARLGVPVVAITGTNGKTTTKDALATLLAARLRTVAPPASFNNRIGVPLTLCRAEPDTEVLVLELGSNAPGEIAELSAVVRPTIALVTTVGPGHLQGLRDVAGVLAEKLAIRTGLVAAGVLFLNGDDAALAAALPAMRAERLRCLSYGFAPGVDRRGWTPIADDQGVSLRLDPRGLEIRAPLQGRHNLGNLLAAAVVARELGLEVRDIAAAAREIRPAAMRMELRRVGDLDVLFDCYNANPASMSAALASLQEYGATGRRVAILGDMLELGDRSRELHRALGREAARAGLDLLVFVGPGMQAAAAAAREASPALAVEHVADVVMEGDRIRSLLGSRDLVLLKGSRGMRLERLFAGEAGS